MRETRKRRAWDGGASLETCLRSKRLNPCSFRFLFLCLRAKERPIGVPSGQVVGFFPARVMQGHSSSLHRSAPNLALPRRSKHDKLALKRFVSGSEE